MQQEQDTCRICSGPGEPDQPLFYPCKCSGTIRYIHQECLKTWLNHSKKTTCDVCKHPYAFTKVYAPDMPARMPVTIIVRKFAEQIIGIILFMLRATLVAFVWLTLLPYGTVLTWRLYFRMGDILAWWISLHPRPVSFPSHSTTNDTLNASSSTNVPLNTSTPLQQTLSEVLLQPYLRSLSTDIFTGQIIASLIVLAFLAVFLLREWIQQNARPGVFDDGPVAEIPAPVDPQPQAEPGHEEPAVNHEPRPENAVEWAPGLGENAAPVLPPLRPVPDVPEDVRPAGPSSSSSSSSSDTEAPPPLPVPTPLEDSLPAFGRRRRGAPKRKLRGVNAARRLHIMDEEEVAVETGPRSRRVKREQEELLPWEPQPDHPSGSGEVSKNGLYALEGGPRGSKATGKLVEEEFPGGSGSEINIQAASKNRQKRKSSVSDTEITSRDSSTSSSTRHSSSPPSSDFKFTFTAPRFPPEIPPPFPATFAIPKNGEFTLRPKTRFSPQSSTPPSPTMDSSISSQSPRSQPLNPDSSYIPGAPTFPSPYSSSVNSRPIFELPPPSETNRGALAELPYPLTPLSSPPPSASSGSLLFPEDVERTSSPPTPSRSVPTLRRPPLPTSTLPTIEHANAEASSSTAGTMGAAPLPSPRLAIYRPPEELEVENKEYFGSDQSLPEEHGADEEDDEEEDDDNRFTYYFQEPEQDDAREIPAPLLPDTDDEDDEDDGHDGDEPHVDAGPPAPAVREAGGQDIDPEIADEERDQNLEEDLDGAMEAVGLRGPMFSVFQNAALMLFILNVSIGGGVWIPFTLGKSIALLTLEPRRAIQILHLPIRAVRLVTDPSVDAVIYCLRFLSISLLAWVHIICIRALFFVGVLSGKDLQTWGSTLSLPINFQRIQSLFTSVTGDHRLFTSQAGETASWKVMGIDLLSHLPLDMRGRDFPVQSFVISILDGSAFQLAEEVFAVFGRHIRVAFVAILEQWVELAEGDGTMERLWAIFLGYAIVAFLAALYLNTITVGNVRSAGRAVRNAIRQQMIVLKVALFIVVELVMFPFGCGLMLDFSTLALFPEATVESRVAFFLYAPITAAFYHWLIGTMFMYQFAILLATCRDILRPGCMWFIKDPQDPTFHPIRDILDRPTLAQLRKLCMSAMMYAVVISVGVGGIVWSLTIVRPPLLPLRWKMREPLSEIPIDLLFVHLILPPTLHYFRPRKPVRRLMTAWWKWAARQLRLTSFMFGKRHHSEEYGFVYNSWCNLLAGKKELPLVRNGGYRRAPAGDNIAFLRDRPALVEVDENGQPLTANGREVLLAQNAEAHKAGRNYQDDYTVVYVPPNFQRRIFQFILLFWLSGSLVLVSAIAVPIVAGRAFFLLFTPRELHDGYSFVVGFYLLWWGWLLGSLIVRIRIRRGRHGGSKRIRAGWLLFLIKRVSVYIVKITWLVLWLGVVLPTLVSIVVDLYLIIPLRYFINPHFTPTIHMFESWATGLILSKIIIRTRQGNDLHGALDTIQRNGWRRPDPWAATRDFIMPVGTGLIGMVLLPPLTIYGYSRLISTPSNFEDLFRLIYPSIFVTVGASQFAMSLIGVFAKWMQNIRDKEFLVELRLRNLDHSRKPEKVDPSSVVEPAEDNEEDEVGGEEDD